MRAILTLLLIIVSISKSRSQQNNFSYYNENKKVDIDFFNNKFIIKVYNPKIKDDYLTAIVGDYIVVNDEIVFNCYDGNTDIGTGTKVNLIRDKSVSIDSFKVDNRIIPDIGLFEGMEIRDLFFETIKYKIDNLDYNIVDFSEKNDYTFTFARPKKDFIIKFDFPDYILVDQFEIKNSYCNKLEIINHKICSNVMLSDIVSFLPKEIMYLNKSYKVKYIQVTSKK